MNPDKKFQIGMLALLCAGCVFLGAVIMGMFYIKEHEDNKVLSAKVEYLQGDVDHYSDLLDLSGDRINELKTENSELKEKLEINTGLHESYEECLTDVLNEYSSPSKLKYGIHQVATINQADDIIYQFIIVIYDDNFSFVDTWNCYSVYDGDELMYTDCDLVK